MGKKTLIQIVLIILIIAAILSYSNISDKFPYSKTEGKFFYDSIVSIAKSENLHVVEKEYSPTKLNPCKGGYAGIDFGEREKCEIQNIEISNEDGTKSWIAMTYYSDSTPFTILELNDNAKNVSGMQSEIKEKNGKSYLLARKQTHTSPSLGWQNLTVNIYLFNCQDKAYILYNHAQEANNAINSENAQRLAEKILEVC